MAQYEDGDIEFAILSLVKEPMSNLVASLAENVKSIGSIRQRLVLIPDEQKGLQPVSTEVSSLEEHDIVLGPCKQYELSQEALDRAILSPQLEKQLESGQIPDLIKVQQQLVEAQIKIKASIRDEAKAIQADNDKAARRRNDRGLMAKSLLLVLERMDKIKSLIESDHCS